MSYNNESSVAGSSRSLNRNIGSPISNTEDPTFWVPGTSSITGHCSDIHSGIEYFAENQISIKYRTNFFWILKIIRSHKVPIRQQAVIARLPYLSIQFQSYAPTSM